MRRNEAHNLIADDQLDGESMETRIARLESDTNHIKSTLVTVQLDVRELRHGLNAANESIAEVKRSVTALDGRITTLETRMDGKFLALETKLDASIAGLETKLDAQGKSLRAEIQASSAALESKLIKWIIGTTIASIGTVIACTGVALAIAKVLFASRVP
jgi:chromosome segregation ATPase